MSSASSDPEQELKAGHPPAVKAGGMRIAQHKPPHLEKNRTASNSESNSAEGGDEKAEGENGLDEKGEITLVEKNTIKDKLVISGAVTKGDADFPPEAVKAFHEKPIPVHENRQNPPNKPPMHINQPRK